MLQEQASGKNTPLNPKHLRFEAGNSNILNQRDDENFKLCFLLLLKMFSENRFFAFCLLTKGIVGISRIMEWFACVVNNVNFITWSTCDQVKAKFCFNSYGGRGGGILSHGQADI